MTSLRPFLPLLSLAVAILLMPSAHADEAANNAIIQATMRYVFQEAGVNDPAVTVEKVAGGYARVKVRSLSGATDPATAYLKGRGDGQWTVITLGTGFTAADLAELGIPASLAN